ncbi:MAG: hypothetical protein IH591_20740 [Bacteroidales bacterium]|nr:hypothetical protein [Bacteroidales bacterium]
MGMLLAASFVSAETLTVVTGGPVQPGATGVTVDIEIDTAVNTAGASFTVTYDTDNLILTNVESSFFDLIDSTTVGPDTYEQALVYNTIPTGVMLAGARATNGTSGQQTIYTLTFDITGTASGDYPISIIRSEITNADAGYPPDTPLPMLVGISGVTYPAIDLATVAPANLTVQTGITDQDNDGIDDAWEIQHFGNTDVANETSDFDQDGYTDLQEYLNGVGYDPKVMNAPGGPGYVNNLPDSFIYNFPDYGLYTYNQAGNLTRINAVESNLSVAADVDADGVEEVISYFTGYGLYVFNNGSWSRISTAVPEAIVKFGQGVAVDFGNSYGLYTYSSSTNWTRLNRADPSHMVAADVDSDGVMELVTAFPSYGLYYFDNGAWSSQISSTLPEQMVEFGKGVAIDYGESYGLYTYSTANGLSRINSLDTSYLAQADVDADGVMELVAAFPGRGLFYFDNGVWSSRLTSAMPEQIIAFDGGIAVDFGTSHGLYTYNAAERWVRISSVDPDQIGTADIDNDNAMELCASFSNYGLYIWQNDSHQWQVLNSKLPSLTRTGNLN